MQSKRHESNKTDLCRGADQCMENEGMVLKFSEITWWNMWGEITANEVFELTLLD